MRANHFSKEFTSMTVKLETYTSSLFGAFSLVNTPYHSNLLTVNRDGHGSLSVGLWEVFYMLTTLLVLFQSNADEYEEMPIAEFGKAMLRGMGWKDGTAIGKSNKGLDTELCTYVLLCILYRCLCTVRYDGVVVKTLIRNVVGWKGIQTL